MRRNSFIFGIVFFRINKSLFFSWVKFHIWNFFQSLLTCPRKWSGGKCVWRFWENQFETQRLFFISDYVSESVHLVSLSLCEVSAALLSWLSLIITARGHVCHYWYAPQIWYCISVSFPLATDKVEHNTRWSFILCWQMSHFYCIYNCTQFIIALLVAC